MLSLGRRSGESLFIYPQEDIDPSMTIEELFRDGPIEIEARINSEKGNIRLLISAPKELSIVREELVYDSSDSM